MRFFTKAASLLLVLFFMVSVQGSGEEITLATAKNVFARLHDFMTGDPAEFRKVHKNGGFLTYDTRIIFVAPQASQAQAVAVALKVPNPAFPHVTELSDWHAVDVTGSPLWSAHVRRLHGLSTIYSDSRCYSAVLYAQGWTKGIANVDSGFFCLFASSPLVRELPAAEVLKGAIPLRKGDVIAVGSTTAKIPTDHVAVFETGQLIFQKVSPMSETPFNLVTWDSFLRQWPPETTGMRFYRPVETLEAFLDREKETLTPEMRRYMQELSDLQTKVEQFTLNHRSDPAFPGNLTGDAEERFFKEFHDMVSKAREDGWRISERAEQELLDLKKNGADEEQGKVKIFLWKYIRYLADATASYQDPYD